MHSQITQSKSQKTHQSFVNFPAVHIYLLVLVHIEKGMKQIMERLAGLITSHLNLSLRMALFYSVSLHKFSYHNMCVIVYFSIGDNFIFVWHMIFSPIVSIFNFKYFLNIFSSHVFIQWYCIIFLYPILS